MTDVLGDLQMELYNDKLHLLYNYDLQIRSYNDDLQIGLYNDYLQIGLYNDELQIELFNGELRIELYNYDFELWWYNNDLQMGDVLYLANETSNFHWYFIVCLSCDVTVLFHVRLNDGAC